MNKYIVAASLFVITSQAALADIIGATAGIQYWNQDWSGEVSGGGDEIHLDRDLDLNNSNGLTFYAAFEHPVPFIPNVRLKRTNAETKDDAVLSRDIQFQGSLFSDGSKITSISDVSHTDATLYYEILDNWLNLDLGFTLRQFDGEISISDGTLTGTEDLDALIPLAFANARIDLPFTGWYSVAEAGLIEFDGDHVKDFSIGLGYESFIFSVEAGYRSINLAIDDSNINLDTQVYGAYLGFNIDI